MARERGLTDRLAEPRAGSTGGGGASLGRGSRAPQQPWQEDPEDNARSRSKATAGAPLHRSPRGPGGGSCWLQRRMLIERPAGTRVACVPAERAPSSAAHRSLSLSRSLRWARASYSPRAVRPSPAPPSMPSEPPAAPRPSSAPAFPQRREEAWLEGVANRDWAWRREAWNRAILPVPVGRKAPDRSSLLSGRCEPLVGASGSCWL